MAKSISVLESKELKIERLTLGAFNTNAYIITCLRTRNSVLIDAPAQAEVIKEALGKTNCRYILLTHNHPDHIGALLDLQSKNFPLAVHPLDRAFLPKPADRLLCDGDTINFGKVSIEVLHTPGHTMGSVCFKIDRALLSGDTIFGEGPGRTNSPEAFRQVIHSIEKKIMILPDDTRIFPGHGEGTVLKKEREKYKLFASRPHDKNLCGDVKWLFPD